jgi:hypothetical protein
VRSGERDIFVSLVVPSSSPAGRRCHATSVVVPIDLLVEVFGIEGAGRTGDAGNHQQNNKSGRDGLHGYLTLWSRPLCGWDCYFMVCEDRCYQRNSRCHHPSWPSVDKLPVIWRADALAYGIEAAVRLSQLGEIQSIRGDRVCRLEGENA